MSIDFLALFFILIGYFLGSISFAVVVSKVMGLADPHTYGSRNPGATNVLRSGHKVAALLTLLGDALKGWLAVLLVRHWGPVYGIDVHSGLLEWVGLAAFVGHIFPLFHRFAGGKGVATALGVLFGVSGMLGLASLLTWGVVAYLFRYSSLAAIVAALGAPFYYVWIVGYATPAAVIACMSVLLIVRHKQNIKNLLAGTESRF
jgi:glycerol-3-phosphate acyltransferase PlsY